MAAAKVLADTVFAAKKACEDVASAELGAEPHQSHGFTNGLLGSMGPWKITNISALGW